MKQQQKAKKVSPRTFMSMTAGAFALDEADQE